MLGSLARGVMERVMDGTTVFNEVLKLYKYTYICVGSRLQGYS
jgi:hypothetical protein